jgi:phage tail-like protein
MLSQDDRDGDVYGDLRRFISMLQDVVDILLWQVDAFELLRDIDQAPAAAVPLLLADLGNPFAFDLSVDRQRKLAALLMDIYKEKGTAEGVANAARFFLGLDAVVIDEYYASSWSLGEDDLGVDTTLGPGTQKGTYTFAVQVDRALDDETRRQLESLVRYMKPAHTHFVIVEPPDPVVIEHWSLGESELGETTFLHEG